MILGELNLEEMILGELIGTQFGTFSKSQFIPIE